MIVTIYSTERIWNITNDSAACQETNRSHMLFLVDSVGRQLKNGQLLEFDKPNARGCSYEENLVYFIISKRCNVIAGKTIFKGEQFR